MKTIIQTALFLFCSIKIIAQPVDSEIVINEAAYTQPFLHCVNNEKYFAKYAVEAQRSLLEMTDTIQCKLHMPVGFNKIWMDIEKSKVYNKGDFDYTNSTWVSIRFNLYVNGVMVSTAYHDFEKPADDSDLFTYYFHLNPNDFSNEEGDIGYAYWELLNRLKVPFSTVVIEAAMPSRNLVTNRFVPIASGILTLKADPIKRDEWKNQMSNYLKQQASVEEKPIPTNYNLRLKYLADSTMKGLFGEIGFKNNFIMTCLQNPCTEGYLYANTLETNNPCTTQPQNTCKEAIVTYNYSKKGVPLTIKMLITLKENGEYVYIENNQFGKKEISIKKQNLLSLAEIKTKINHRFPKDSLAILGNNKSLSYSHTRIQQPETKHADKFNSGPGYRIIKETRAGKVWENGFIYTAYGRNPNKLQRIYFFDAVTGKLLWITEIHNVPS